MNNNSNGNIKKGNSSNSIPQASFFKKLKDKIVNFFKFKPKIYLLGLGETLEINGKIPSKPLSNLLNKFGSSIDTISSKPKEIQEANQIKNPPEIYSNALAISESTPSKKSQKSTKMLNKGNPNIEFIVPEEVSSIARTSLNSDSNSTLNTKANEQTINQKSSIIQDALTNKPIMQTNPSTQNDSNIDLKQNYVEEDNIER